MTMAINRTSMTLKNGSSTKEGPAKMIKPKKLYVALLLVLSGLFSCFPSSTSACWGCMGKSNSRACFANMKTIAGAIEMYNLDFNVDIQEINQEFLEKLKKEGYLQSIPVDPDFGDSASSAYLLAEDGLMFCINHGFIQPPEGYDRSSSPFEQLKASGETREGILARASHKPANRLSAGNSSVTIHMWLVRQSFQQHSCS